MQPLIPSEAVRLERPKMSDIARLAGVSPATVSRALAGSPLVTADTRARVAAAVSRTGYVVNHAASGLRQQRARQILVMLPTIANPFFAELVLGIEEEAQAHGFGVLIGNTGGDAARERALARQVLTGAVDGLVLLTGRRPQLPQGAAALDGRVVAVSERVAGREMMNVTVDNVAGAATATRHLIALGHRRIAHVGGPQGNILTTSRLRGWRTAMRAAGLPAGDDLVASGDFSIESGAAAARHLLAPRPAPTALFCSNDEMAIGAVTAATALGIAVPDGLSICGFDDIPFAAAYNPPLTTVRQPRRELGRTGAALLLGALLAPDSGRRGVVLPLELVIRRSTGPVPAGAPR